jgi:hypothetical protein
MPSTLLFMVVLAGAVAGGGFELPLTVVEPAGVARKAAPASGGIPLPAGVFAKGQPFALFDGDTEVPCQILALVIDGKDGLRWVLVDLQTDLEAGETRKFVLRATAPKARPPVALKVVDGADAVTVDTGPIRFAISKREPFSLFTSVEAGGKPVVTGGEVSYTDCTMDDAKGTSYLAVAPETIEIEYVGLLRVTLCVRGRFQGDDASRLGYIARITAWAGRSDVHVKYSLANSNPDHYSYRQIQDSRIALKLAGAVDRTLLGAKAPQKVDGPAWMHVGLKPFSHYQDVSGHTRVGRSKEVLWTGSGRQDAVEGWIAARTVQAGILACDLFFAEDPARKLETTKDRLVLTGVAECWEGPMDTKWPEKKRRIGQPFGDLRRWLFDCSHLSSQYVIDFAAPTDAAGAGARAKAAKGWLHVMAPPAWYFDTESLAVGRFATQADELKCYETWGWTHDPQRVPKAPGGSSLAQRYVQYEDNHYETEQDTVESLLLMYLRTGSRPFLTGCQAWANWEMDLQKWRTDGWRYKDGGVWWPTGGPLGNRPQRPVDPVTGRRNSVIPPWAKKFEEPFDKGSVDDLWALSRSKQCYCHNYGSGIAAWYCITGERDALEAAIDSVEQQIDTQRRAFRKEPGTTNTFSRDFTRSCYLVNAVRLAAPTDPFVVEASDWLASVYLRRPRPEPRGLIVPAEKPRRKYKLQDYVGEAGLARMKELGVTFDADEGQLHDPKTGATWYPLVSPHTWMFPPLSGGMEIYARITGDEDAHDWVVAYGQAVARVLYQLRHGTLAYGKMLVDFPVRGVAHDWASWHLPADSTTGEGVKISGYLARFHPDVCGRAYSLTGDPFLKQRAYDYWYGGSHRGYNATTMHDLGGVGMWVNAYGVHSESCCFTGRTMYEWAHPREDATPPAAVRDLRVSIEGGQATVSFTAPVDKGGRVTRYQVKCSDRPLVGYEDFLKAFNALKDGERCNWWLAANVAGEPAPKAPGGRESFTVAGVPAGARYFAVRSYDGSSNRSALSNVAEVK